MRPARILNRLKDVAFLEPFVERWARAMRGRVTCLLYHRVGEPGEHPFLDRGGSPIVAPDHLREELGFLVEIGARFGTFRDLREGWFPAADEIGVIVSFDDGFRSNYTTGMEVLSDLGIPAVFFQTTGMLERPGLLWEHALYWRTRDAASRTRFAAFVNGYDASLVLPGLETRAGVSRLRNGASSVRLEELLLAARETLGEEAKMAAAAVAVYPGPEHVRRARDTGHEIGSHGHRHYRRATIDEKTFETDLARSRAVLTELLGTPPRAYSYPFDSWLEDDDSIVSRHFDQAATVRGRRIERDTDPMWLPRFTWPGPAKNSLRLRRWLLRGTI